MTQSRENPCPPPAVRAFRSIDDVREQLDAQGYLTGTDVCTVVYLAARLEKPILVEGPAGVGKTELAKVVAAAQGRRLVRLQCYEGLDEAKALYEWEYAKQLLYTQMLRDKIDIVLQGAQSLTDAVAKIRATEDLFFSEEFLLPRPLLQAITSEQPVTLLIDEVDKADPEFEAFLLEVLSDFSVTVPELGTMRAKVVPQVILTSNNAREMSDALKRRCLHLYLDFPDKERERRILTRKVPDLGEQLARQVAEAVARLRTLDLRKAPSISETLDWARALVTLGADHLDSALMQGTLNVLLKHQTDVTLAQDHVDHLVDH